MAKANDAASRAFSLKIVTREQARQQELDTSRTLIGVIDGELSVEAIIEVNFLPAHPKSGVFYHLPDGTMWFWANSEWQQTGPTMEKISEEIEAGVQRAKEYTDTRGFVTKATDDLENYYTRSETYTKEEVDAKIIEPAQSDWTEDDDSKPSYIKNKPLHLVEDEFYVHTDNNFTTGYREKVEDITPASISGEILSI